MARLRSGSGLDFGTVPNQPDRVGLIFGAESWWVVCLNSLCGEEAIPKAVIASKASGKRRQWRCAECDEVQDYVWTGKVPRRG